MVPQRGVKTAGKPDGDASAQKVDVEIKVNLAILDGCTRRALFSGVFFFHSSIESCQDDYRFIAHLLLETVSTRLQRVYTSVL